MILDKIIHYLHYLHCLYTDISKDEKERGLKFLRRNDLHCDWCGEGIDVLEKDRNNYDFNLKKGFKLRRAGEFMFIIGRCLHCKSKINECIFVIWE